MSDGGRARSPKVAPILPKTLRTGIGVAVEELNLNFHSRDI